MFLDDEILYMYLGTVNMRFPLVIICLFVHHCFDIDIMSRH